MCESPILPECTEVSKRKGVEREREKRKKKRRIKGVKQVRLHDQSGTLGRGVDGS